MLDDILSYIFIIVLSSFPLLLWGYGSTYLSDHVWNRARFVFGMIGGSLSVLAISLFHESLSGHGLIGVLGFVGLYVIIGAIVWYSTSRGSLYIKGFLRKILILHTGLFLMLFFLSEYFAPFFLEGRDYFIILGGLSSFLVAASIEEGVKHVSSIGLTAREFRFSRRDFLLFTFFIILGFVTLENAIYMIQALEKGPGTVLVLGLSRILFSLPLHVFASSLCVVIWWKALSYGFFSLRYIVLFTFGYVSATLIHALYNYWLPSGSLFLLFGVTIISYVSFTQWIIEKRES